MITVERDELATEYAELVRSIQRFHFENDTEIFEEMFIKNKPSPGARFNRAYFRRIDKFYLQYFVSHLVIDPAHGIVAITLKRLIIYDNFIEYNGALVRALSSVKPDEQSGLNLN